MKLRSLLLAVVNVLVLAGAEPLRDFRLPNGLRVLLAESHERPLVRLELRSAWDPSLDPPGKAGLGGFLADLLKSGGASPQKREAFQRFIEDRALRLTFTMHARSFAWSILTDSQGQDGAFESLALAATRQDLDPTAVEARRQRHLLTSKERPPRLLAEGRFRRSIGDPTAPRLPEEASLVRIEFQDLLLLSRRILRPEASVLVIHGDMNLAQARQLSMLHLGAWGPSPEAVPAAAPAPQRRVRTWLANDTGRALQIRLGSPRAMEGVNPDTVRSILTGLVKRELALGQSPTLAEIQFQAFPEGGWTLAATAAPDRTLAETMGAVQGLMASLRAKRIGPEEWSAALQAWKQERQSRSLHPQQEAGILAQNALASGTPDASPSLDTFQSALGTIFAAADCFYFISGAIPQDAAWLEREGFGPVASVN